MIGRGRRDVYMDTLTIREATLADQRAILDIYN